MSQLVNTLTPKSCISCPCYQYDCEFDTSACGCDRSLTLDNEAIWDWYDNDGVSGYYYKHPDCPLICLTIRRKEV